MKTFLIVIILLLIKADFVSGQKRDYVWCFGDSCLMDFNSTPPSVGSAVLRSRGTACSISDSSGNLLFYCGSPHVDLWQSGNVYFVGVVYNRNHEIMEGGDTLACELWYNEMVIVPDPNFNGRYFLFHMELGIQNPGLYYSIIDLSYNNGLGKVVSKNNQLLMGNMADCLNAIKHGNGRDWWVIARRSDFQLGGPPDNDFYVYLVDTSGITALPVQSIGTLNPTNLAKITFNPSGEQFVFTNINDLIELYDFDRCSGTISNPVTIQPNAGPGLSKYLWSAEFSGSGEYLYTSTSLDTNSVYQFDTYASNIAASRVTINDFTLIYNSGGVLKRGPDGKIYYASAWNDGVNYNFPYPDTEYNQYNMNLGVINQPDSPGVACDFQPFSFYLGGKRNYWGLPNNPDYDLPQLYGSACDTLGVQVNEISKPHNGLTIFPNPSNGIVNFYSETSLNGEVKITDALGKIVLIRKLNNGRLTLESLKAGIYSAGIVGESQPMVKFIVIK